ncbi:MAG: ParB/RepB/Spo0J family partition protein, partial [Calditrichaeota bacterium]
NVQREQLNPIDLAKGYQQLMDECGLTQEEVAKKIGKDRSTVTNILRLLKLPPKIQESLQQGEIKEGHARALLGVSDSKEQERIWRKTVKNSLSVREVERLVRKHQEKHKDKPLKPLRPRKAAYYNKLESRLREKLGTQVKIRPRKDGGTIEISYFSPEDLERLMEIFDTLNF